MKTALEAGKAHYQWAMKGIDPFSIQNLLGKQIEISFLGDIFCVNCGNKTPKSFGDGFCFNCFQNAAQATPCIIRPELCEAHLGKGRDITWEEEHHNQPHTVYLALTAEPKVGVTRNTQIPTRWIDQGASQAIRIAETPYRQLAGAIEVYLKQFLSDKTDWRRMLCNLLDDSVNLAELALEMQAFLPDEWQQYTLPNEKTVEIEYPVEKYPLKISSVNLDKTPTVKGILTGIRGQYLYFDDYFVMNVRRHCGYHVNTSFGAE